MNQWTGRTGVIAWSDHNSGRTSPEGAAAVVMIHSLGMDRTMWDTQVELLSSQRRLMTMDLPGHGASTANPGPYTLDQLGQDVLGVVDECGITRFEVVGLSIGGLIAMWLAVHAPERVSALVAANTAARLGSPELWSARIASVEAGGMEAIRQAVIARFFSSGFEGREPIAFSRANQVVAGTDPRGYIGCCAALRDGDLTGQVSSIRCRTLIVAGGGDVATPTDQAQWLHERIEGSRLEVIADAAHLSNLDRPEIFNSLLGGFLLGAT